MADESLKKVAMMLDSIKKGKKESEAQLEHERKNLVLGVGKDIVDALTPFLVEVINESKTNKADFERAISAIKIQNNIPDINVPEIVVPTPRVTVMPPEINIPDIVMPKEMDIKGWVSLMGVDLQNPLPVQLRDASGKPVNLLENLTTLVTGGSGGGVAKIVKVSGILTTVGVVTINPDGNPTYAGSGAAGGGLTDAELRASSVPVTQASDANWSVSVKDVFQTTIASSLINGDDRIRVSVETGGSGLTDNELRATAIPVSQVSGANWSVTATVSGSITSTVAVGDIPSDEADTGSAPIKIGGIARTANPTAVAANDRVSATFDTIGRQIMRPLQVRGLLATAYTSLTTGTETSLLAGATSTYHDLVWIMGANQSDVAVLVDIRSTTGGNVLLSLEIPANSTAGIAPPIPYPASDVGASWTLDMDDITGTTVDITALFSKEI